MTTKIQADLAIQPRWVIPVDASARILENHVVVIANGRIVDILSTETVKARYEVDNWVPLRKHALLPGFVNTHTHAAMTLMRGFADDLPLMEWLNEHIWPAESNHVDDAFVAWGSRLAIIEMIRGGTTCFNDMYFYPDVVAANVVETGIRASLGMIVLDMPTQWASNSDEYIEKGLGLHDRFRFEDRITTAFAPHAPYTVEDPALRRIQTLADELDVQIHIHLHETNHEIEISMDRFGMRPLERLAQLGLATPRLQAVHMTHLMREEIDYCALQGLNVVHCPQSNMKLASGFSPVSELLSAGINVALGTDGAASNNDLDMIEEMRMAALLAKGISGSPTTVPAHTALEMATINGARALGLDDRIGSLEPGKYADMIAIDLDHPRTQPLYDPVAQIVYSAASHQVSDVWVAGQRLLEQSVITCADVQTTLEEARQWKTRLC